MQIDLVFEGGGAKGIVFAGAMETFFNQGYSFGRLLGTSAGAISATFLAAGYSIEEMLAALSETDAEGNHAFANFMGQPRDFTPEEIADSSLWRLLQETNLLRIPGFIKERFAASMMRAPRFQNLFAFIERGGWYAADAFVVWLQRKLDAPFPDGRPRGYSNMTLQQFYAATKVDLSLVAADTTGRNLLVLNQRTAPDCPLVFAVRMSMSVPLLWEEVVWQPGWGLYRQKDISGHAIVDGGLLSNFPLELFVSGSAPVTAVMGDKVADHVFGLFIDESLPVPDAPDPPDAGQASPFTSLGRFKTIGRLNALIDTMTQARDKSIIDAFAHLVIRLPAKGYGTTEFNMTPERRAALVKAGRQTMAAFLDRPAAPRLGPFFESSGMSGQIADRVALSILSE